MRARANILLCTALLLGAVPAGAQGSDAATQAKELFVQGREAVERGKHAQALVLFQQSQKLYPIPGTLLNMAICEEKLGKIATAWQHYREVAGQLRADDTRLPIAQKGESTLAPRVPWLRIDLVGGAAAGARVTQDSIEIPAASLGIEQPVEPGPHVIVVTAPRRRERRYDVTVAQGKHQALKVELGEEMTSGSASSTASAGGLSDGAPVKDTAEPPSRPLRTAGFVIGGVGLVGLGVGGATGILAFVKKGQADKLCNNKSPCIQEGIDVNNTGKTFATVSTISFAVGLAGVGAGIALVVVGGKAGAQTTALAPLFYSGGGGIAARGTF